MKKLATILTVLTLMATTAFAGSNSKLTDTAEAVTEALKLFERDNDAQTVEDFKGLKASPNSHGLSVKIYMNNRGPLSYSCHRHSDNEPFECHDS